MVFISNRAALRKGGDVDVYFKMEWKRKQTPENNAFLQTVKKYLCSLSIRDDGLLSGFIDTSNVFQDFMEDLRKFGILFSVRTSVRADNKLQFSLRTDNFSIHFDGVPFRVERTTYYQCSLGSKYFSSKRTIGEESIESAKWKRKCYTKKKDCPAKMVVKHLNVFTEYKVQSSSWRRKLELLQKVRTDLTSKISSPVDRYMIIMSPPSSHNHPSQKSTVLSPDVVDFISDLNAKGCDSVTKVKRLVYEHVDKMFVNSKNKPSRTDETYYPKYQTVHNHMTNSRKRAHVSTDRVALKKQIIECSSEKNDCQQTMTSIYSPLEKDCQATTAVIDCVIDKDDYQQTTEMIDYPHSNHDCQQAISIESVILDLPQTSVNLLPENPDLSHESQEVVDDSASHQIFLMYAEPGVSENLDSSLPISVCFIDEGTGENVAPNLDLCEDSTLVTDLPTVIPVDSNVELNGCNLYDIPDNNYQMEGVVGNESESNPLSGVTELITPPPDLLAECDPAVRIELCESNEVVPNALVDDQLNLERSDACRQTCVRHLDNIAALLPNLNFQTLEVVKNDLEKLYCDLAKIAQHDKCDMKVE